MKPLSEQEPEQQSEQKNSKVHQAQQTNTSYVSKPKMEIHERMQHIGREFVDICQHGDCLHVDCERQLPPEIYYAD